MLLGAGKVHLKFLWSGKRGSNPRHQAWEACTLPTELFPPYKHNKRIEERNQEVFYQGLSAPSTSKAVRNSPLSSYCRAQRPSGVACLRSHAAGPRQDPSNILGFAIGSFDFPFTPSLAPFTIDDFRFTILPYAPCSVLFTTGLTQLFLL